MSKGVRGTDVANIVIVIETSNILRKISAHCWNGIGSLVWINMWLIINSWKLSVNSCSTIEDGKVLINCNRAPVRNKDISVCFAETWKRMHEGKHHGDLFESNWSNIIVWTILKSIIFLFILFMALIVDFLGFNQEQKSWTSSRIDTQEIFAIENFNGLFFVNSDDLWEWFTSTLMEFWNHKSITYAVIQFNSEEKQIVNQFSDIILFYKTSW